MSDRQRNFMVVILVIVLVGSAAFLLYPLNKKVKLGLDLQGGLDVILKAVPRPGAPVTQDAMDRTQLIIDQRVNGLGVAEPVIQRQGTDQISIQLPGIKNSEEAIRLINKPAFLEFREVLEKATKGSVKRKDAEKTEYILGPILMTGKAIETAKVGFDQYGGSQVDMTFTAEGSKEFASVTTRLVNKRLAIILDNEVKSAPNVNEPITGGKAQITGKFTTEEAKNLALVLQTGALPVNLQIQQTRTVGPTLGQDSLHAALLAGLIGLLLVAMGMIAYYRGLGLIAVVALAVYSVLLGGVLVAIKATLTLPGIAGLILTIGVAVDANIIIYERIKEEIRQGKSARSSVRSGFAHSLGAILDANFLTVVTAGVLFWLGSGAVRGFALNLLLGVFVSLLTALFFTRALLEMLMEFDFMHTPFMLGAASEVEE